MSLRNTNYAKSGRELHDCKSDPDRSLTPIVLGLNGANFDNSQTPQQQADHRGLTSGEVGKLFTEFRRSMTRDCANFLSKCFSRLKEQYKDKAVGDGDFNSIFSLFFETAENTTADGGVGFSLGYGQTYPGLGGRFRGKPAVRLAEKPFGRTGYDNFDVPNVDRFLTIVHELIHSALTFGLNSGGAVEHSVMYDTAYDAARDLGASLGSRLTRERYESSELSKMGSYDTNLALEFDSILKKYCGNTSGNSVFDRR